MSRRTNKNPSGENWAKKDSHKQHNAYAHKVLNEEKKKEDKRKVIYVPHPTIPRTMIRKFVD